MTAYAIYRHSKHKNMGTVTASSFHMNRMSRTPNADPDRAHLNRVLIGSEDPAADVAALVPALDAVDGDGKKRRRTNSVITLEVLLTASPEWWAKATPDQQQKWLDASTAWLVEEYGRENIAHLRLHGDEQTPHLTGFIVPLDPETGHLNARKWVGGATRCAQQQTDYAASVESLGLVRGVEGSAAEHESVKRHYSQIAQPIVKLSIARPPRVLMDPEGWAAEQRQSLAQQAGPVFARARTAESDRTARKAAEARAAKAQGRADRLQAAMDEQKALSARLRALPLPDVLDALGFVQDKTEKVRWKADGFNITVGEGTKAGKWFDHAAGIGKGGSIDLVQHVTRSDFKAALAWMADRFGPSAAAADLTARFRAQAIAEVKAAVAEREPFTPPPPAPEHWRHVREHLTKARALPRGYIDRLHELGDLYADEKRNAVFVCRDPETNRITGAEIKGTVSRPDGTRFTGMAPGSRKEGGGFRVGDIAKAATVYLVESAIDAISLFKLRQDAGERGHAVISTAGATPEPRTWFAKLADTVRRVCAFDNDKVGDEAAHKLRRHKFERLKPSGKDWNDDLKAARDQPQAEGRETPMQDPFTTPDADNAPSPFEP
jgi:Plasmid recombination enzyme/Toprim-like/Protein of unknown function (DUF3991)